MFYLYKVYNYPVKVKRALRERMLFQLNEAITEKLNKCFLDFTLKFSRGVINHQMRIKSDLKEL